jgi:hypothetical protein
MHSAVAEGKPILAHRRDWRLMRAIAVALVAAAPLGCVATAPSNPFVGTWTTADNDRISFESETLVVAPSSGPSTVMSKTTCPKDFRFGYSTMSREALAGLIPHQADLRRKLSNLLVRPDYPVAEMNCDQGFNTYVLLGDRELVAIYRDGDVAGLDRFSRL